MDEPKQPRKEHSVFKDVMLLLFGVGLPLATLGVELFSRMCSSALFDPVPTIGSIFLVAAVPTVNLICWLAWRFGTGRFADYLILLNGAIVGIAFPYALVFLPFSIVAVFMLPLGLLPLAPFFSLIVACQLRPGLSTGRPHSKNRFWAGFALGIILLTAIQVPFNVTRLGLQMAASNSPRKSARGIILLRAIGNRHDMIRFCYGRSELRPDPLSFALSLGKTVSPDSARTIYYRVTGKPYSSVPQPVIYGSIGGRRDFDLDAQGEQAVGGRLNGLKLIESRQDGSIDPAAALAYIEWTMVFRNETDSPLEARAEIALPSNAVVSRVTLWIDGEEREAAFGTRAQTASAYKQVVQRRLDPLLVTTHGRDRVLMQCFPVNPDNGTMKVRIGMTVPLSLQTLQTGLFVLPRLTVTNFQVPAELVHLVWMESSAGLQLADGGRPGKNVLRRQFSDDQLNGTEGLVRFVRPANAPVSWSPDPFKKGSIVQQTIEERPANPPGNLFFVVDASESMKSSVVSLPEVIGRLPVDTRVSVLLAGDLVTQVAVRLRPSDAAKRLNSSLQTFKFVGGQNNAPALARALEEAGVRSESAIVWVHDAQPVFPGTIEALRQWFERRSDCPYIYEYQVSSGPCGLLDELDGTQSLVTIPRLGGIRRDLADFLARWQPRSREVVVLRERANDKNALPVNARKTSDHLIRLWAAGEVARLAAAASPSSKEEATRTAVNYRLVTPVSGAVVLETKEQYDEAGLKPLQPGEVPTVPEPGEWALLAVALIILAAAMFAGRRRTKPCRA